MIFLRANLQQAQVRQAHRQPWSKGALRLKQESLDRKHHQQNHESMYDVTKRWLLTVLLVRGAVL
jgi:hypothetical protein